jgi:hypothetical protein
MDHPRPLAEPPPDGPTDMDFDHLLDFLPPADRDLFAAQFIADKIAGISLRPLNQQRKLGTVTRLAVPLTCRRTPSPPRQRKLVEYHVPLDKAHPPDPPCFPQGLVMDPSILIRLVLPRTPFEFPFDMPTDHMAPHMDVDLLPFKPMDSVTHIKGLLRVCGLKCDNNMAAWVTRLAMAMDAIDNPSLMDRRANICITGILSLLVNVETIPPLPILVATTSGSTSLDDCCTKRGLLPLTLADGSVYYQPCYYCKNAMETIISLEAIIAASDTLVHWTQTGHKGADPGSICFSSDSGLYSIMIALEKHDGFYYCPTDVFTVDQDPVQPSNPIICRAIAPLSLGLRDCLGGRSNIPPLHGIN